MKKSNLRLFFSAIYNTKAKLEKGQYIPIKEKWEMLNELESYKKYLPISNWILMFLAIFVAAFFLTVFVLISKTSPKIETMIVFYVTVILFVIVILLFSQQFWRNAKYSEQFNDYDKVLERLKKEIKEFEDEQMQMI